VIPAGRCCSGCQGILTIFPLDLRVIRQPNRSRGFGQVPELGLDLPSNAVGKDFLPGGSLFARAPSGSGFQVSLYGLAGVLLAVGEGFELNVLGLNIGMFAPDSALEGGRFEPSVPLAEASVSVAVPKPVPLERLVGAGLQLAGPLRRPGRGLNRRPDPR
jgi:hypothetical protein